VVIRHRIWQLEGDVAALLLVDARRRVADRRQHLLASGTGAVAGKGNLGASAEGGEAAASAGSSWPSPAFRPSTSPAGMRPPTAVTDLEISEWSTHHPSDLQWSLTPATGEDAGNTELIARQRPVSRAEAARAVSPTLTSR
jgi:hypothetical protein